MSRYHRQILLPQIAQAGQERLAASRVLLVGCGALGSVVAEYLVRAGVGTLIVADRDIVELTNLQRQVLFDESDARDGLPKAVAAAKRLTAINRDVRIEPKVVDVSPRNIESLAGVSTAGEAAVDLIVDGADNVQTRYLINDLAVKHGLPWIYGACVGAEGRVMTIRPGGACLRCIFPTPPRPEELPTCDTAGVLGPAAGAVGALQSAAAIKWLSGNQTATGDELLSLDLWRNRFHATSTSDARPPDCPCCGKREFPFLESVAAMSSVLCGRNAVQVQPMQRNADMNLTDAAARLANAGQTQSTPYFVRCRLREIEDVSVTLFPDGRAIIHGIADPGRARAIYARYIGA